MNNGHSINEYRREFRHLTCPDRDHLKGEWTAHFVGPRWLTIAAPIGLNLVGLRGWRGKLFLDGDLATNIIVRQGKTSHRFRMKVQRSESILDHRPAVRLSYGEENNPRIWKLVVDEFRVLSGDRLLGMSFLNIPLARKFPLPFMLVRP